MRKIVKKIIEFVIDWSGVGRSLLSHDDLIDLIDHGVITADKKQVNGASIDLTLHDLVRIEYYSSTKHQVTDLYSKQNITTKEFVMTNSGIELLPGQLLLAASHEFFDLPNNIVAEYILKSSMARNFLNSMFAGYCDPGWYGSRLTLELKNETQYHTLILKPGMPIGQMKFYRVARVPKYASYAVKGQYNNQTSVQESKGIR